VLRSSIIACALALVVYFMFRRNLFVGIATGFVALVALTTIGRGF